MMIRLLRSLLLSVVGAALPLTLFFTPVARAQAYGDANRARLVQHYCQAHEIFTGLEADERARILSRFDPVLVRMDAATRSGDEEVLVALVDSNEINAFNHMLCKRTACPG